MEEQKWTPESLAEKLKAHVIGQDRYLKDLCTAVWLHNLWKETEERSGHEVEGVKLNMLVLGKSGTGKTFAIQSLAKLLDLNLVIEDASLFTGAGWKGRETTSIVKDIVLSAGAGTLKAQYSIVVLDEMDKLFADSARTGSFSAVSNFLKLIEGTYIEHTEGQTVYHMNTENVLFICLGAFDGLEEIIARRMRKGGGIGFCAGTNDVPEQDIFQYAEKEDLIAYGINPQFLGRMAMITATNELKEHDFVRILTQSESSVVAKLNTIFQTGMGVRVSITEKAAQCMAKRAVRERTGGRALLSEVMEAFREGMYQIAGREDIRELRLGYAPGNGLEMQFVKGIRDEIPVQGRQNSMSCIEEEWKNVPLEMMGYPYSLAGAYQYVEELTEAVELEERKLSGKYPYRQIRAAMYLIMSAVLSVMSDDIPQNMYEVARTMQSIVSNPPDSECRKGREDTYVTVYWKSLNYEIDSGHSAELALYILQEYCRQWIWEEQCCHSAVS